MVRALALCYEKVPTVLVDREALGRGMRAQSLHHLVANPRLYRQNLMLCGYWITSSARATSDCGIVSPRALAVFRLMAKSNLVGCSTGRSPSLTPP